MGGWVHVAGGGECSTKEGEGKAVGETAASSWQPTLTAAGTEQPGKEDLGRLSSLLGTTHLLSGKGFVNWLCVSWEGFVTEGGAQWLSSQGFVGRQS